MGHDCKGSVRGMAVRGVAMGFCIICISYRPALDHCSDGQRVLHQDHFMVSEPEEQWNLFVLHLIIIIIIIIMW